MKVELVSFTPHPEYIIELAYLRCRNLDPKETHKDKKLGDRINDMWKSLHVSPLEFADATFNIEGVSRACSHQFVRHRIASYEQLSMRSVEPKELQMIIPPDAQSDKGDFTEEYMKNQMQDHVEDYYFLRDKGLRKEDARMILPIGIETMFYAKMNFRSWLHFLYLRTSPHAQWEIRTVAKEIEAQLREIAPHVFNIIYKDKWGYV